VTANQAPQRAAISTKVYGHGRSVFFRTNRLMDNNHDLAGIGRDHAPIFRELAVNQLRSEANVTDLEPNVVGADRDLHLAIGAQDALKLQHALDSKSKERARVLIGWRAPAW
jgi:hypothetical protein